MIYFARFWSVSFEQSRSPGRQHKHTYSMQQEGQSSGYKKGRLFCFAFFLFLHCTALQMSNLLVSSLCLWVSFFLKVPYVTFFVVTQRQGTNDCGDTGLLGLGIHMHTDTIPSHEGLIDT